MRTRRRPTTIYAPASSGRSARRSSSRANRTRQARRGFYLGEALRALGREDEARAAWKGAAEAAPDDELGAAARETLDHAPPPYR